MDITFHIKAAKKKITRAKAKVLIFNVRSTWLSSKKSAYIIIIIHILEQKDF